MALANKDHHSTMAVIQASAFFDHNFGGETNDNVADVHRNGDRCRPEPGSPKQEQAKNPAAASNGSSVSSPGSTNSINGVAGYGLSEEGHSHVVRFKPQPDRAGMTFRQYPPKQNVTRDLYSKSVAADHGDEYPVWEGYMNYDNGYQALISPKSANHGLPPGSHYTATGYPSQSHAMQFEWMNNQETNASADASIQETTRHPEGSSNKRPYLCMDASSSASKKPKPKSTASPSSKDTQSIAAKNRRERISERLKILQDLVPNGSKVDLVTMLEKAISYVKFLQLQVKVLATDEFWPAQGGKAPDLAQVREAIDAILATQRDRSSSSK